MTEAGGGINDLVPVLICTGLVGRAGLTKVGLAGLATGAGRTKVLPAEEHKIRYLVHALSVIVITLKGSHRGGGLRGEACGDRGGGQLAHLAQTGRVNTVNSELPGGERVLGTGIMRT